MKTYILFLTLIISYSAQSQSADTSLQYSPLQIGNTWEYALVYSGSPSPGPYYYTVTVTGDTTAPNRLKYFVLRKTNLYDKSISISLKRVDSATACIYQYVSSGLTFEFIADSLRAKAGDKFGASTCMLVQEGTLLGMHTTFKEFQDGLVASHGLAYGFGRYTDWEMGAPYDPVSTLLYARINNKEFGTLVGVEEKTTNPHIFSLSQNFPNPFNPSTSINFSLPQSEFVTLVIRNILGQTVQTLVADALVPGNYIKTFDGKKFSSGIYFYTLRTPTSSLTKMMVLIK